LRAAVASSFDGSPSTSCAAAAARSHPLAEPVLVVQQVADVVLGVLELGRPVAARRTGRPRCRCRSTCTARSRCEPVEHVALPRPGRAGTTTSPCASRCRCTSRALAGAQHADRAVLLEQRDHAAGAGRQVRLDVRVLPVVERRVIVWSVTASPLSRPLPCRAGPRRQSQAPILHRRRPRANTPPRDLAVP
jgi:hypothetical protein